jgi:hypothetical protein
MPHKYWDQAFLIATQLINRTPSKAVSYDIPLHRLLKATPDYSNIRLFGCAGWLNTTLTRSSLDPHIMYFLVIVIFTKDISDLMCL